MIVNMNPMKIVGTKLAVFQVEAFQPGWLRALIEQVP